MKFRQIWRLSFCFVWSFWLFKELLKKILKKILNALVIPRIFLICATATLMDFRYNNLVEKQSNNFDDFQNFFLHLEALEKIVNFSNCFWQVCCPGYAYCCEGGRNCCVKKEHPMLRFFPTGKVTPKIEVVKPWI